MEANETLNHQPFRKRRVLVADDNPDTADVLSMLIREMGHDTHTAYNGREAVETAERVHADAAILDIGMPEMNGFDVARSIRAQSWGKEMILVALTGWGQDEDKRQAAAAGFDHHLTKPAGYEDLVRLLGESTSEDSRA